MILHSLRLWNIKSYGDGAEGRGVTVEFAPGINRIAGRNGHGKTTLIEALGYALFFARPVFEESFDAATYLLRTGKKEGEIDATFSHGGERYRVERGLGAQSRRRAKVVQLSDESIAAEGDEAVVRFLCRLFGLADAAHLAALFGKLAGVKQGRLTWPFDSKAAEAKRHFEPLLEVEIFRQSFDGLKPVIDEFDAQRHDQETKLSAVRERLRERGDSTERLAVQEKQAEALAQQHAVARVALGAAEKAVRQCEEREKAALEAGRRRDAAQHALTLAVEKRSHAAQQLAEATAAAATVAETAADAEAFAQAGAALERLHERQQEKSALDRQRAEVVAHRAEIAGQAAAAEELARTFLAQREARAKALAELDAKAKPLAAVKSDALEDAQRDEKSAAAKVEAVAGELKAAREAQRTLKTQLDEIAGGTCPFLRERCQQFDLAKVRGDLREKDGAITALEKQLPAAREAHRQAKAQLDRLTVLRAQAATALEGHAQQAGEIAAEMKALAENAVAKEAEAAQWRAQAEARAQAVAALDVRLKPLTALDQEVRAQQQRKARHEPGHQRHLIARPLAAAAAARQQALEALTQAESAAAAESKHTEDALAKAAAEFDPATLASARQTFQDAHAQLATLAAHVANAQAEVARERQRAREYQAALKEGAALERELGHLRAASELTQKARTLLQKAAPYVAQHICRRVASQAQRLFNRINHDPVELEWEARNYSLRVHPGERRFAMLSGGEQTKLALAMTLAMIQDFSALRFCVFDEPTYGVDAESRDRLAEAIVEVQADAAFDQLLLVSHDDAFDGKIENVVLLRKTATGTQVE
jgi:exonuclease SbcC